MNREEIEKNNKAIREQLDLKTNLDNIVSVEENLIALQSLSGLCAEVIKNCEINLYKKQEEEIHKIAASTKAFMMEKICYSLYYSLKNEN